MRPRADIADPPAPLLRGTAAAMLRARIEMLLRDPAVAQRVGRRLGRNDGPASGGDMIGTPPCLRTAGASPRAPLRVKSGCCRGICRSVDCLCGRYPRSLSEQEIGVGRRLEPLAV